MCIRDRESSFKVALRAPLDFLSNELMFEFYIFGYLNVTVALRGHLRHFLARARAYVTVMSVCPSVRLSVCLSIQSTPINRSTPNLVHMCTSTIVWMSSKIGLIGPVGAEIWP